MPPNALFCVISAAAGGALSATLEGLVHKELSFEARMKFWLFCELFPNPLPAAPI